MTEAPPLIGRHRIGVRGTPLSDAVPVSTRPPDWNKGGKPAPLRTADEIRAAREERRDAQPIVTLCAFCGWRFEGTAGDARTAAANHRAINHPEANVRRPRNRRNWKRSDMRTDEENAQATLDAAERNRIRAEREEADLLAKVLRGQAREEDAA